MKFLIAFLVAFSLDQVKLICLFPSDWFEENFFDQILCASVEIKSDQNENSTSFYTAAVVELNAPGDKFSDPEDIVDANLAEYLTLIQEASEQGVDILVFPEATLNYNGNFH